MLDGTVQWLCGPLDGTAERYSYMPCHDILIETVIKNATPEQIASTTDMWRVMATQLGLRTGDFNVRAGREGNLVMSATWTDDAESLSIAKTRYQQSYVARQIFDALVADGYEMEAWVDPDHEGTWVIRARDISRNATIGVVVYHTLEFEIDFLDALHDDSVWLSGGEFGRVIERIKAMGLAAEVVKLDIDEEAKRHLRQANGLLA